jgi:hypothetical protein
MHTGSTELSHELAWEQVEDIITMAMQNDRNLPYWERRSLRIASGGFKRASTLESNWRGALRLSALVGGTGCKARFQLTSPLQTLRQ